MICTSRGSVLINNSPSGFFSSSCGLRQGDPLSPYLFILAEEILSLHIKLLKSSGKIEPISPVPSTPCHLLYADDILLFLKARKAGLRHIYGLLLMYQSSSGLNFNLQKSSLYLGKCSASRAHMVSGLIPITRASSLPFVYLGVPLFFGTSKHYHFNKILDAFRSRLDGWKAKSLSFVGRLILIKHVLSSIPLHASLVIPFPTRTCMQIEKIMRNFLWSSSAEYKRKNLVKWDQVCVPKAEGGLGLRRIKEFNEACLMKLAWSAATSPSIWASWFRGRYFRNSPIWSSGNPKGGSCIWKKIRSFGPVL